MAPCAFDSTAITRLEMEGLRILAPARVRPGPLVTSRSGERVSVLSRASSNGPRRNGRTHRDDQKLTAC